MTVASGVGSHPGDDQRAYDEAVRLVLGELPELAYLPEVPGRGPTATMTGRALAVLADLGADLQPAGWRLTDAPGIDHRRARSLLAQDLDTLEEQAQGYTGAFKVQVAGPWTLAATVERPRGDKVLADFGARRDLAQALAEGLLAHVSDVRRRVPGASRLVVQVDEPALAAVLAGAVPTASGFGRHRTVHPPEASEALAWVLAAVDGGRCRAVGALLRPGHAARPAARRRRARAVRRPRPAVRPRPRRAGGRAGGGGDRGAGRRGLRPTRRRSPPTGRSPRRCCAGRRCSAWTSRRSATGWC